MGDPTGNDGVAFTPHLSWSSPSMKGGSARFRKITETTVSLVSTVPSPPGSRIDATFADAPDVAFRLKIHGSKKRDDGLFDLEGRPIDVTRDVRARAASLVGDDTTDATPRSGS